MWNRIRNRIQDNYLSGVVAAHDRIGRLRARFGVEAGAITIEYILIIALIAIIIITLFTVLLWPALRPAVEGLLDKIKNAIAGGNIA
jgi:Flp pilus assembly pilin Flp